MLAQLQALDPGYVILTRISSGAMHLRVLLLAAFSSLGLLASVLPSLLSPNQELLSNDMSSVGKRTSRKVQQPGVFRQYVGM